jgi:hypothetical protein
MSETFCRDQCRSDINTYRETDSALIVLVEGGEELAG